MNEFEVTDALYNLPSREFPRELSQKSFYGSFLLPLGLPATGAPVAVAQTRGGPGLRGSGSPPASWPGCGWAGWARPSASASLLGFLGLGFRLGPPARVLA